MFQELLQSMSKKGNYQVIPCLSSHRIPSHVARHNGEGPSSYSSIFLMSNFHACPIIVIPLVVVHFFLATINDCGIRAWKSTVPSADNLLPNALFPFSFFLHLFILIQLQYKLTKQNRHSNKDTHLSPKNAIMTGGKNHPYRHKKLKAKNVVCKP